MILQIYSIKDKAVNAFLQPFFSPTIASANRSLSVVVNDRDHDFHKHVDDYTLFKLGDFDDSTGAILPNDDGPTMVCPLAVFVKPV